MSLNFIEELQIVLHQLLSGDENIRLSVDRIYISVIQDAKYPFLLINISKANNISKSMQKIYEVDFSISIFAREKSQKIVTKLANNITRVINPASCHLNGYVIAGINHTSINCERANDLISYKLIINFKALIKANI